MEKGYFRFNTVEEFLALVRGNVEEISKSKLLILLSTISLLSFSGFAINCDSGTLDTTCTISNDQSWEGDASGSGTLIIESGVTLEANGDGYSSRGYISKSSSCTRGPAEVYSAGGGTGNGGGSDYPCGDGGAGGGYGGAGGDGRAASDGGSTFGSKKTPTSPGSAGGSGNEGSGGDGGGSMEINVDKLVLRGSISVDGTDGSGGGGGSGGSVLIDVNNLEGGGQISAQGGSAYYEGGGGGGGRVAIYYMDRSSWNGNIYVGGGSGGSSGAGYGGPENGQSGTVYWEKTKPQLCDYRGPFSKCISNQTKSLAGASYDITTEFEAEPNFLIKSLNSLSSIKVSNKSVLSGEWKGNFNLSSKQTIIKPGASFKPRNRIIIGRMD